jgi:hypothetical protein
MNSTPLVIGAALSVVVEGERLPRASDGDWVSVESIVPGREGNHPSKLRSIRYRAIRPEFQVTPISHLPGVVEIEEQVDPTIPAERRMHIEVDMHVEKTPRLREMEPSSFPSGIGEEGPLNLQP